MLNQSILESRDAIRQGLKQPYLAIEHALHSGFAEELRDDLLKSKLWAAQDEGVMSDLPGRRAADNFEYSRKGIILGDPRAPSTLESLHQYLNSAPILEWFSAASGRKCDSFEGVAAIFKPGDHISRHNDFYTRKNEDGTTQSRALTFNYWLTKDWKPEYGGRLVWERPYAEIIPTFNTLVLFLPTRISEHWVEPVVDSTPIPRLSVTGWFMTRSSTRPNRLKLDSG